MKKYMFMMWLISNSIFAYNPAEEDIYGIEQLYHNKAQLPTAPIYRGLSRYNTNIYKMPLHPMFQLEKVETIEVSANNYARSIVFTHDDKGNVLSKKSNEESTSCTYDGSNNIVQMVLVENDGTLKTTYQYQYTDNKLVETRASENGTLHSVITFIYDANSIDVLEVFPSLNESGTVKYYFNSSKKISKYVYVENNFIINYSYDSHGNMIKDRYSQYFYNNQNKLIREEGDGYEHIYAYDDKGNIVSKTFSNKYGQSQHDGFFYNAKGQLIRDVSRQTYLNDTSIETRKYTYDISGNLIKYEYDMNNDGIADEIKKFYWKNAKENFAWLVPVYYMMLN